MDDSEISADSNRYSLVLVAGVALLAILYFITGSTWLFIILVPLTIGLLYSSISGKAAIGIISLISGHASDKALAEFQGNYYSWGNQQIRVIDNGDLIWVVDEDVLRAIGMKPSAELRRKLALSYKGYGNVPGTRFKGFTDNGVMDFLSRKQENNTEVTRLKLWFEREVFFPIKQKRN